MKTVVLCGGKATRMSAITNDEIPKHLLPIGEKTVLDHALQPFIGTSNFIFALGHHATSIQQYWSAKDQTAKYVVEQEPKGVPTAIVNAAKHHSVSDGHFAITHADEVVTGFAFNEMIQTHHSVGALATVLLTNAKPAYPDFQMEVNDGGRVQSLRRGGEVLPLEADNIGYGIGTFVCAAEVLPVIETAPNWENFVRTMIDQQQLAAHIGSYGFYNFNTPEDMALAQSKLQ